MSAPPLNFYKIDKGAVTHAELQQAFQRIFGKSPALPPSHLLSILKRHAKRFEFEVDRARGLAFDLDDDPPAAKKP